MRKKEGGEIMICDENPLMGDMTFLTSARRFLSLKFPDLNVSFINPLATGQVRVELIY